MYTGKAGVFGKVLLSLLLHAYSYSSITTLQDMSNVNSAAQVVRNLRAPYACVVSLYAFCGLAI